MNPNNPYDISVEHVDHMGSDLSVVNAARVSFDKQVSVMTEADRKLIKYLATHRHTTPFRHTCISIRCRAPIFLARQLGKHQVGLSWNEVSRRYVASEPSAFEIATVRMKPEGSIKQGSGRTHPDTQRLSKVMNDQSERAINLYNDLIASDVAPELARAVLPQGMVTEWIWTGSVQAFAHVFNERVASGAQEEAQSFAMKLNDVMKQIYPVSWEVLTGGRGE